MTTSSSFDAAQLRCGPMLLNLADKSLSVAQQQIALSPTSFSLLACLMEQAPAVVSVDELLAKVWQGKVVNRETVKQQVRQLREQLGEYGAQVESVRGFGYRINAPQERETPHETAWLKPLKGWRNQLLPILIFIGCILAYTLFTRGVDTQPAGLQLPLMTAVMPFTYPDNQDPSLPPLLQDQLTTMLSRQNDVRVLSVSSVQAALQQDTDLDTFARERGIDMLFEGAIRHTATGFEVNIRMVWTRNQVAVWRDQLTINSPNREALLNEVTDSLRAFINKKTAYIKQKRAES